MTDTLLALNAGSSSFKFAVADATAVDRVLVTGSVERLGSEAGVLRLRSAEAPAETIDLGKADHHAALTTLFAEISARHPDLRMLGVGHRIVHGGADLVAPVRVTADVMDQLEALVPLAPLHQPHGIAGVRAAQSLYPDAVQVACFDTAFHARKPKIHDSFALPRRYYEDGLRCYGFHGLSCQSVCTALTAEGFPLTERLTVIAHLGNGCSVTAVRNGQSIANSMGFSVLDGLAMGTRCGRIDPGALLHLLRNGHDAASLERLLYRESGLLALSGMSNDMRDLAESETEAADFAIEYFVARAVEEICRMAGALGGLHTVVFSGGIGENAAQIRQRIAHGLAFLPGRDGDGLEIRVQPANEEQVILQAVGGFVSAP